LVHPVERSQYIHHSGSQQPEQIGFDVYLLQMFGAPQPPSQEREDFSALANKIEEFC
jgi:hypothetical protein